VEYLREAKEIAVGGRSLDQERAQTYALIALVEAARDMTRKLELINSKLGAALQRAGGQGGGSTEEPAEEALVAEAQPEAVPKTTRRRATKK